MIKIIGIDEAGRGPVIGPLVVSGVMIDEKDKTKLKDTGVKDSKLLSEKQRKELIPKIEKIAKQTCTIVVPPEEVDFHILDNQSSNLNLLEADKQAEIINLLNPDIAIIDCPSNNIEAYTNELKKRISNKNIQLIVEHKADFKYPVVSAASILAKEKRENEVKLIRKKINADFGSGYPSDPKTKQFLENNYEDKKALKHIRKSWAPYQKLKKNNKQKTLSKF